MLELLGFALLVGFIVWFFPAILALFLALCAVAFCLFMAAVCWVKELFTPTKKPTK